MKVIVIIPAHNEENTIANVVSKIPRHIETVESVEVLLIDDGSTDNTVEKAIQAGVDHCLIHKINKGLGTTFADGLDFALERGADIIVNIDADEQYYATQIPILIKPIINGEAHIVLGWRDIDRLDFMPKIKKLGNKIATWITSRLSGLHIIDAQSGFRAFSREAGMRMFLSGKYTYVQETLIQAARKGLQIEQIPIEFRLRKGKSRLISNIFSYAARAGIIIFSTYLDYQSLRFFSIVGSLFVLTGLGFGIRVLRYFYETGTVSQHLPSAILASLLIIVGLGTIAMGALGYMLNTQGKLNEEILYRLKKAEGKQVENN